MYGQTVMHFLSPLARNGIRDETFDERETYVSVSLSPGAPAYSFDNDDVETVDRHTYLGQILDELTLSRLAGLGDLTGKRFLEVGAGGGSVARWMADQAGPSG